METKPSETPTKPKFTKAVLLEMKQMGFDIPIGENGKPQVKNEDFERYLQLKEVKSKQKQEAAPSAPLEYDFRKIVEEKTGEKIDDEQFQQMLPAIQLQMKNTFGQIFPNAQIGNEAYFEAVTNSLLGINNPEKADGKLEDEEQATTGATWDESSPVPPVDFSDPSKMTKQLMGNIAVKLPDILDNALEAWQAIDEEDEKLNSDPETAKKFKEEMEKKKQEQAKVPTMSNAIFNKEMIMLMNMIKDVLPIGPKSLQEDPIDGQEKLMPSRSRATNKTEKKAAEVWWSCHDAIKKFIGFATKSPTLPLQLFKQSVFDKYGPILSSFTKENVIAFEKELPKILFLQSVFDLEGAWEFIRQKDEHVEKLWQRWAALISPVQSTGVLSQNFTEIMGRVALLTKNHSAQSGKPPNPLEMMGAITDNILNDNELLKGILRNFKSDPKQQEEIFKMINVAENPTKETLETEPVD